jgi:hypothetical protein
MSLSNAAGLFALAALVLAACHSRRTALTALALTAPLQGFAVFAVAANGFPAFAFAAAAFCAKTLIEMRNRRIRFTVDPTSQTASGLLFALYAYALLVTCFAPSVFEGIEVFTPRLGLEEQVLYPAELTWQISNAAQLVYLTINTAFVVCAAFTVPDLSAKDFERAVIASISLVISFLVLSLSPSVSSIFLQPLLYNYAYSSEERAYQFEEGRLFVPFLEPSFAGMFVAACGAFFLACTLDNRRPLIWPLSGLLICSSFLLLIDSSAGWIAFVVGGGITLIASFIASTALGGIGRQTITIICIACLAVCILVFSTKGAELYQRAYQEKLLSASFVVRSASNEQALSVAKDTYYFGAGVGSNRVSSLLNTLFSSLGIFGVLCFAALFLCPIAMHLSPTGMSPELFAAASFAVTLLVAGVVAVPDISYPYVWFGLAWMIVAGRGQADAGHVFGRPSLS